MGVPLNNERRTSEFSANQQVKPQGKVLPWLMTMPSPNEAMNIGTRPDKKRVAESNSAPEGRSGATQLMPIPDGLPRRLQHFRRGAPLVFSGSVPATPLPGDHIGDTRPAETYIALKRSLRIAEHEGRKSHATPESSAENLRESSGACATEITPLPGLQLKEEIANIESVRILPRLTLPLRRMLPSVPSTRGGTLLLRRSVQAKNPKGFRAGSNEWGLLPRANHPMPDDEIASVAQANQLERDWIRAVSAVPNADSFQGGVDEFKQSDLAVPTQGSKTGTRIILVASIFTASVLCIWTTGLKPFPDLPHGAEMASPAASVSSKQGLEGMRAPDVEETAGDDADLTADELRTART